MKAVQRTIIGCYTIDLPKNRSLDKHRVLSLFLKEKACNWYSRYL